MAENVLYLMKIINLQIQETQQTPRKITVHAHTTHKGTLNSN